MQLCRDPAALAAVVSQAQARSALAEKQDPYRIWISEIMLQQTRVSAVLPYYARFLDYSRMSRSGGGPEQDLLAAWAGLGYYSRARNLAKGGEEIVELRSFPRRFAALLELAGRGRLHSGGGCQHRVRIAACRGGRKCPRVLSRLTGRTRQHQVGCGAQDAAEPRR